MNPVSPTVARIFYALKDSLEKLDSYHKGVELTDSPAESCSFFSYRDEDGLVSFKNFGKHPGLHHSSRADDHQPGLG